jgi:uncharacterized protein
VSLTRCPICDLSFDTEHSDSLPFCSARCKRIDLARWFDERYSMPIERPDAADDDAASAADQEE